VEGPGALPTAHAFSGRRMLSERRSFLACGNGCLNPKLDPSAVASAPSLFEVKFSTPYQNYAGGSNGPQMSYGICLALGCNYRNVTVAYITGDTVGKQDFAFSVVFYTLPGVDTNVLPAAFAAALPSTNATASGTIAYGLALLTGGALTATGVYAGIGNFTLPPPSPPPSSPSPSPPLPPPPPSPSPLPPPFGSVYFTCTCTNGWSGADCLTAPL